MRASTVDFKPDFLASVWTSRHCADQQHTDDSLGRAALESFLYKSGGGGGRGKGAFACCVTLLQWDNASFKLVLQKEVCCCASALMRLHRHLHMC